MKCDQFDNPLHDLEATKMNLPSKLVNEPILESVFEIRMKQDLQLSDLLPSHLYEKFDRKPIITLPAKLIPKEMRVSDSNLNFAPLSEIELDEFSIRFGDRHVTISCKLPYPGWKNFKKMIIEVLQGISGCGIEGDVERYSIKFVNILESESFADQIGNIKLTVNVGENQKLNKNISLELEQVEKDVTHILTVRTNKSVIPSNSKQILKGIMFNVDSIIFCNDCNLRDFVSDQDSNVEKLKQSNKKNFLTV